jgi:hypothetical protein
MHLQWLIQHLRQLDAGGFREYKLHNPPVGLAKKQQRLTKKIKNAGT